MARLDMPDNHSTALEHELVRMRLADGLALARLKAPDSPVLLLRRGKLRNTSWEDPLESHT
jgi:hypothetical protein